MTDIQDRPLVDPDISVDDFAAQAEAWLESKLERRPTKTETGIVWGEGEFDVSVFHAMTYDVERAHLDRLMEWVQAKAERGYHAITWPTELGGLGLSRAHSRAFGRLERQFLTPGVHETLAVTRGLIAPTINVFGTDEQKQRWIPSFVAGEVLCCQLFSEPGAGSDLAGLACKAVRDGDEWVVNGQKVWSSGAQFSQWGELIARTDPDVVKHQGMTAFVIPMDLPGIEIRPIAQMSGGSSFCEVFFNDVRVPDDLRLGEEGDGWKVALTTLGFERDHSEGEGGGASGGSWSKVLATANALGVADDPIIRDGLVKTYIHSRIESMVNRRAADLAKSGTPGPEGSLGKLIWTEGMYQMTEMVSAILGAKLTADTGEWGTYEWTAHVLGAPGYRIAGGSDEVQRNIIGERVLGLPREPKTDTGPWKDVPR
ncbi:MAG: acyl-CoA dehydrogenase family protein [Ilumatobacter sp.]|uniref:acyl-CoA dehydrogenase family protein n=1 Tax=Ilumatobacter sp. TaxID=1967498 RepID=UPI00391A7C25